jgi:hypothetical protein
VVWGRTRGSDPAGMPLAQVYDVISNGNDTAMRGRCGGAAVSKHP